MEWSTNKENTDHAIEQGLKIYKKNSGYTKKVVQLNHDGKIINIFDSIHEAFRQTKISMVI